MFHWFICVVIGSFVLSFAVKAHYAPHPTMLRPHRTLSAPVHHITFLHQHGWCNGRSLPAGHRVVS